MRILTFTDAYLPAYKYGGPVQTLAAMVSELGGSHEFWIVTRCHDLGERLQYAGITPNQWLRRGNALVYYLGRSAVSIRTIARLSSEVNPDIVYVNGVFSRLTNRYLLAMRLGQVPRRPYIVAPRGELSPGAMKQKSYRKRVFMEMAATVKWFQSALWQASTHMERDEIAKALNVFGFRPAPRIVVSQNMCAAQDLVEPRAAEARTSKQKVRGEARFVFISRISPKKNLLAAIEALFAVRGNVSLDVYGPREDQAYWGKCLHAAKQLRTGVSFNYRGELLHADVGVTFSKYDFFVFPTFSENFGHVIMEALFAGCPVVLSDQTPWADLEDRGAGWVIPLAKKLRWTDVLQSCVDMGGDEYRAMTESALQSAQHYTNHDRVRDQNIAMFQMAMTEKNEGRIRGGER